MLEGRRTPAYLPVQQVVLPKLFVTPSFSGDVSCHESTASLASLHTASSAVLLFFPEIVLLTLFYGTPQNARGTVRMHAQ